MNHGIRILISENHGTKIPMIFGSQFVNWGVTDEQAKILALGDASEEYWEIWDQILDTAKSIDFHGNVWRLYHDHDLFAVCENLITDKEFKEFFGYDRPEIDEEGNEIINIEVEVRKNGQ